jgi:hypothetical protein
MGQTLNELEDTIHRTRRRIEDDISLLKGRVRDSVAMLAGLGVVGFILDGVRRKRVVNQEREPWQRQSNRRHE